jgi:hypothetical protein
MKTLQNEIRRQFGSAGTARFLRALPVFRPEAGIPKRFASLLTELERAEDDQRNAGYAPGNGAR